jgi:single-stranded DNA-specific DHH superfamily exonuclease
MISEEHIKEIREHLEKAQNPLFFFDNDNDGLTSFLLLRRFIHTGKGIAIKSFPELDVSYYKRVEELKPDYIFILDKPAVSDDFLIKTFENNLPVVWIDHHVVEKPKIRANLFYYNNSKEHAINEPVSYICYKITNKKDDLWIAVIGCISDCYIPDFYEDFFKEYPELGKTNPTSAFDLLYKSEIGKITTILDFSLKDSVSNVVSMIKFMIEAKSPMDILEENPKTKQILKRYEEINKKYQKLIQKARHFSRNKILFFQYGGDLSLSGNLANQLIYEYPDKLIVTAFIKGDVANISLRGKGDVRKLTLEAIKDIKGATGGGHKNATGAKMSSESLPIFRERIEKLYSEIK